MPGAVHKPRAGETSRTFRPANFYCLCDRMMVWAHGYAVCDGCLKPVPRCTCHRRDVGLDETRAK